MAVTCAGTSYCKSGEICCFDATSTTGKGTTSCVAGPPCPSSLSTLVGGEFCTTDSDCQGGAKCLSYDCAGTAVTACAGSLVGDATFMCGSGSGS